MAVTIPRMTPAMRLRQGSHGRIMGVLLALAAGVYQAGGASLPINDDFLHFTLARQVLAGDWPVRDFFDSGLTLMYGLSALSQSIFGYRLLAEAVIVGTMTAIATYVVFRLVQRLTDSTIAAVLAAILVLVATPRGYSYPKVIVYAVAAALWWAYVSRPVAARAVALGAWTAAAFYWRPDHGVYVATGVVLAVVAAHGFRILTIVRCVQAGATAAVLMAPFFLLVANTMGLRPYVESGMTLAEAQHVQMDSHALPAWPIRHLDDVVRVDAAEVYAPTVTLRWKAGMPPGARTAVIARHGLAPIDGDEQSTRVRLNERSLTTLRALVNEPAVEDTAGIDRSTATLPWATWPAWQRWSFNHAWLRVRMFPGIEEQTRAGEAVAALFYAMPLLVLIVAVPRMHRYLGADVTPLRLAAFAVFGIVTNFGLLRTPYAVRAVEGVVLPAILCACVVAAAWRGARIAGGARHLVFGLACVAFAVLVVKSVAVAGQFGERIGWMTGEGRSRERALGAWTDVRNRLVASPPLSYWPGRQAPIAIQLATYANACVPPSDRLLVLWFAPEIYYYADRLMAPRHLVFVPGYQALAVEQQLTLAKIERFSPPIVFANSGLDTSTREIYPAVVDYVHREYELAATLQEDGERYLIFRRKDRRTASPYGAQTWPCYA